MNKIYLIGQFDSGSRDFFVNMDTARGTAYLTQYYLKHKMHPIVEHPERTKDYFHSRNETSFIKLELIYD